MPRVTVVMATYNWAPVLPYSIASVLDQTFADFELLVIGDGCTDESAEVVGAIDDDRVHWHDLDVHHGHQSGPNNEGLARAEGTTIAYLGHDDLWLPHHLATVVAALDDARADGGVMAHASTLFVNPRDRPRLWPDPGWRYVAGTTVPPTTVVHDRDQARAVGGWRPPSTTSALDPDADLWARLTAGRAPHRLDSLTSIKLSAAHRRQVYGQRPHHEQEWWLARMRAAEDPEGDIRTRRASPTRWPRARGRPTSGSRGPNDGGGGGTRWRRIRGRPAVTSAERFELRRRYKGLS